MDQVQLGRSDLKVSEVGLGMWQAGGQPWGSDFTDDDCVQAMKKSYELGVNLIDTAEAYGQGHSEEVVGKAVAEIGRENLVIATKVVGNHLRYDHVRRACEASLKRLGVDAIDVYQIHWPDPWLQEPLKNTMRALDELYHEGKVRAVAVSNFAVRDLEEARSYLNHAEIVSNQVRYNMIDRQVEEEVVPYCRDEDITVLAWGPIAKGILTGKYSAGHTPKDPLRADSPYFKEHNMKEYPKLVSVLEEVGKDHGKTAGQVALNWLLRDGGVIPIPGAKNPEQAEENAGAGGWRLSAGEVSRLNAARADLQLDLF